MDDYLGTLSCVLECVSVYLSVCFSSREMHLNAALSKWKDGRQVLGNVFSRGRRARVRSAKCCVLSWNELLVYIHYAEEEMDIVHKLKR